MRKLAAALSAAALFSVGASVVADEVWQTQHDGLIVYEADIGTTAVLTVPRERAEPVVVYVPGLGGEWGERRRQSYDGYYVGAAAGGPCEAALQAVDERTSHDWGDARVILTERWFPTTLLVLLSPCGGTDEELVVGRPVVAGD